MSARPARKRYWNETKLSLWERVYLFEVFRGLAITGGVFFRNMWKWVTGRKGAVTAYYPEEVRADYSPANRGRHILTRRPDGDVQCIACNLCATVCPAYCIEIVAGADFEDPTHPRFPVRFEIDYSRCIFCGFCVEACPEDAIRMSKDVPNLPRFDLQMWTGKETLASWQLTSPPAKVYPIHPVKKDEAP